jgi:hypothetical protein
VPSASLGQRLERDLVTDALDQHGRPDWFVLCQVELPLGPVPGRISESNSANMADTITPGFVMKGRR